MDNDIWDIPDGLEVDHIDRNPSNNRISNLRLVTSEGNSYNSSGRKNGSSQYKVYIGTSTTLNGLLNSTVKLSENI